jgi:hypothetical protein
MPPVTVVTPAVAVAVPPELVVPPLAAVVPPVGVVAPPELVGPDAFVQAAPAAKSAVNRQGQSRFRTSNCIGIDLLVAYRYSSNYTKNRLTGASLFLMFTWDSTTMLP